MARKPNYAFERQERDRAKAIKLAEKAEAKRQLRERGMTDDAPTDAIDGAPTATPAPDEA
jgi:hypothetical protein